MMNIKVKCFEQDDTEAMAEFPDGTPYEIIALEFIRQHSDGSGGLFFIEVGDKLISAEDDKLDDGSVVWKTAVVEPNDVREFLKSVRN